MMYYQLYWQKERSFVTKNIDKYTDMCFNVLNHMKKGGATGQNIKFIQKDEPIPK